jgi:hypothetical protein
MKNSTGSSTPSQRVSPATSQRRGTLLTTRNEPKLTLKQETFVNALLETGNQYEAYCRAYECKNMSRGAIDVEASKLLSSPQLKLHF